MWSPGRGRPRALASVRPGQTLAVAESLTGGLLAATLVEIPGVSAVFRGGLVVYATDSSTRSPAYRRGLLAERGPVDPDVARRPGRGRPASAAGPTGAWPPPASPGPSRRTASRSGLVFVAVAGPAGTTRPGAALAGRRAAIRAQR